MTFPAWHLGQHFLFSIHINNRHFNVLRLIIICSLEQRFSCRKVRAVWGYTGSLLFPQMKEHKVCEESGANLHAVYAEQWPVQPDHFSQLKVVKNSRRGITVEWISHFAKTRLNVHGTAYWWMNVAFSSLSKRLRYPTKDFPFFSLWHTSLWRFSQDPLFYYPLITVNNSSSSFKNILTNNTEEEECEV